MKRRIPAAGAGAEPRPPGQNPVKLGTTRYNSVKTRYNSVKKKTRVSSKKSLEIVIVGFRLSRFPKWWVVTLFRGS